MGVTQHDPLAVQCTSQSPNGQTPAQSPEVGLPQLGPGSETLLEPVPYLSSSSEPKCRPHIYIIQQKRVDKGDNAPAARRPESVAPMDPSNGLSNASNGAGIGPVDSG
jgi:hypothetical protein